MKISNTGLDLIKSFEGLSLKSYICPAGVYTIGFGHTGVEVTPNQIISLEEADNLLRKDVNRFETGINSLVTVDLNQSQFDSLVSLSFNIGLGAFKSSTLLRVLNAGQYIEAASQFLRWNKGGGRVLPGLVRRREAESQLFVS